MHGLSPHFAVREQSHIGRVVPQEAVKGSAGGAENAVDIASDGGAEGALDVTSVLRSESAPASPSP